MTKLIYTGTDPHNESLPGVPASDHDCEDDEEVARRVASGLYKTEQPKRRKRDAAPAEEE